MNKLLALLITIPCLSCAATLTNQIQGVGLLNANSGIDETIKPHICIQNAAGRVTLDLAPGETGDANAASGNAYYAGAAIRFNGCSTNDSYLGYIGFSVSASGNNSISNYSPPQGVHIAYLNPSISSKGLVSGSIDYTPITTNLNFNPPSSQCH
ncbi:hypothetical protein N9Q05_02450 [bacterium]|nr:hypothetical protein [bacterium]